MKDPIFQLADIVRETGYAIHAFHGSGHLEKVYENALAHRLWRQGLRVERQKQLQVLDDDRTVIGDFYADLVVNDCLIVEVKAANALADHHFAQILGYLRSARMQHGVLVNFGAPRFEIRKFIVSQPQGRPMLQSP